MEVGYELFHVFVGWRYSVLMTGTFAHFYNCFLCPLITNVKDSWKVQCPILQFFPIILSLLGNNRCPTRGMKLQLRHQSRTRFHIAFQKCSRQAWRCSPTASPDRKHLQDCLCFCSLQSSSASFLRWNENSSGSGPFGVCVNNALWRLAQPEELLVPIVSATSHVAP